MKIVIITEHVAKQQIFAKGAPIVGKPKIGTKAQICCLDVWL